MRSPQRALAVVLRTPASEDGPLPLGLVYRGMPTRIGSVGSKSYKIKSLQTRQEERNTNVAGFRSTVLCRSQSVARRGGQSFGAFRRIREISSISEEAKVASAMCRNT
jgi:hypothetical protein